MDAAEPMAGKGPSSQSAAAEQSAPEQSVTEQSVTERSVTEQRADGLTQREQEVLAFERQWWKYAGAKEQAIRELFGMSPTRYYQILNRLIDKQEAMRADPMLIKRLRKARAARQRTRAARRLGIELR